MWKDLTMQQRADIIFMAVKAGMRDMASIRSFYDETIGSRRFDKGGGLPPYSAGRIADALWKAPNQEYVGEPSHHYDFTQSEAWADAHGFYPDSRGHRDDRVKKPAHPSHPSKGTWSKDGKIFNLSDTGFKDPNYIFFGLADGGQDSQATLMYNGAIVLPEITVTPKGNYYLNSYDNYKLSFSNGGYLTIKRK